MVKKKKVYKSNPLMLSNAELKKPLILKIGSYEREILLLGIDHKLPMRSEYGEVRWEEVTISFLNIGKKK